MKKRLTLGLLVKDNEILLGMKKRGFGKDRWNGFGGKLELGETTEQAMIREFDEEAGIKVLKAEKRGIINFEFQGNPEILEMHIFKILEYLGHPRESDEMKPEWFNADNLPFNQMWPDDPHWYPLFRSDKKFKGDILFKDQNTILSSNIQETQTLD